jgi:hypothetical protein
MRIGGERGETRRVGWVVMRKGTRLSVHVTTVLLTSAILLGTCVVGRDDEYRAV